MQHTQAQESSSATLQTTPLAWLRWARLLLLVAAAGAGYLAAVAFANGPLAGCGPGSGCDKVLSSRWAYWLDIPVSVPALVVYLALFVTTFLVQRRRSADDQRGAWMLAIGLSIVIAGAAIWFVGLQMFVIEAFCKFCLVAHACGFSAAILFLKNIPFASNRNMPAWSSGSPEYGVPRKAMTSLIALGTVGTMTLVGGQLLIQKQRNVVKEFASVSTNQPVGVPGTNKTGAPKIAIPNSPNAELIGPRLLSLYNGQFLFQLDELPMLGSPDAPNVIVNLFDYNCFHCRMLHPMLKDVQQRFGAKLGIVLLPMPMDRACNPYVPPKHPTFTNSCDYARLSLAVWQADKSAFGKFDDWLFSTEQPAPVDQVREYAARLVGAEKLENTITNDWIQQQIVKACNLHYTNWQATAGPAMPQIIIGPVISAGALNSRNDLILLLEKYLGIKP